MKKIFLSILIAFLAFSSICGGAVLLTGCNYSEGLPENSGSDDSAQNPDDNNNDESSDDGDESQDGQNPDEEVSSRSTIVVTAYKYVQNIGGNTVSNKSGGGSVTFKFQHAYSGGTYDLPASASLAESQAEGTITLGSGITTASGWFKTQATAKASPGFSFGSFWSTVVGTIYSNPGELGQVSDGIVLGMGTAKLTMHVTFNRNIYSLIFDTDGGDCAESSRSLYYEEEFGTLPTPTRTGYTFTGWYYEGFETQAKATDEIGDHNTTIYASWSANSYTVTYSMANGGSLPSGTATTKKVNYDSTYGTLPTPTRFGYTFKGWYTAASSGTKITSSTKVTTASNHTLYAQWTVNSHKLKIDPNGGYRVSDSSTSVIDVTKTFGSTEVISERRRDGYSLHSWRGTTNYIGVSDERTFTGTEYYYLGSEYKFTNLITVSVKAYSVNWSDMNSGRRFISCTESGGWNFESNNGNILVALYQSGVGYTNIASSTTWASLSAGWHTFTFTFDGSYGRFYLDGVHNATSAKFTSGAIGYNSTNSIFIGAEAGSSATTAVSNTGFKGKIKNVFVANAVMSATDIASLHSGSTLFLCGDSDDTIVAEWERFKVRFFPNGADQLIYEMQSFSSGSYRDTNHTINWSNGFIITTQFCVASSGARFLIFGNYSSTSANCLNIEIATSNKMRVYINGGAVDINSTKTVKPNVKTYVEFSWNGSNTWTLKCSGGIDEIMSGTISLSGTANNTLRVGCQDHRGSSSIFGNIQIASLMINTNPSSLTKYYKNTDLYGYGTDCTLPSAYREGYSFAGWYDSTTVNNLFDVNSFVTSMQSQKTSNLHYDSSTGLLRIAGPYGYDSTVGHYYYRPDLPAGKYTMSYKGYIDSNQTAWTQGQTSTGIKVDSSFILSSIDGYSSIASMTEAEYSYTFEIPDDGSWTGFYIAYNYGYTSYMKDICLVRSDAKGTDTTVANRIDSFEDVDLWGDKVFYAKWLPNPVEVTFGTKFEDEYLGNTYILEEDGRAGFQFTATYYAIGDAGNSVAVEDDYFSYQNTLVLKQYEKVSISDIRCLDGWVCTGIVVDNESPSDKYQAVSGGEVEITNTAKSIYVCFKKVSENKLKYDYVEKYFYFEDGLFPQTAVVTYDSDFNTALSNGVKNNAISNIETFVSNGITFYNLIFKEDDADEDYYAYNGHRFLGFAAPQTKTLKLRNEHGALTDFAFNAGDLYFFKYEPIRWRVSDYGVSEDNPPADWNIVGEGQENKNVVSDVLWVDAFNDIALNKKLYDKTLSYGSYATESSLMNKLAYNQLLGNDDLKLEYSTTSQNIELNQWTSSTTNNSKVTSSNGVWGEAVWMRYLRFCGQGSTVNAGIYTTMVKVETMDGTITTYVDAVNNVLDKDHVTGLSETVYSAGNSDAYHSGNATITFDEITCVKSVFLRRYYADGRQYYKQKIEYSLDGSTWYTYWDSNNTGSYGNHDDTNIYTETAEGRWFNNGRARVASLSEIDTYLTDLRSRASHLVCVLTGQNQTRYAEYWTRDFGQQIGLGTSVSSTGTTVTNSAYDQSTKMRYLRFTCKGSTANSGNHVSFVKVHDTMGNEIVLIDAVNKINNSVSGVQWLAGSGENSYYETYEQMIVDIGSVKNISSVCLRRYYSDGRSYYGQKIEYSEDGNSWYTYWDSGNKGYWVDSSTKVHVETGMYTETVNGKIFGGPNIKGVRFAMTMSESSNAGYVGGIDYTSTANASKMAYSSAATIRMSPLSSYNDDTFEIGGKLHIEITLSSTTGLVASSCDVNDAGVVFSVSGNKLTLDYTIKDKTYIGQYSFVDIWFNKSVLSESAYNSLSWTINSFLYEPPN